MKAPAQMRLPRRRGVRPAMAALRRAGHRLAYPADLNDPSHNAAEAREPAAEADLRERPQGEGQHWPLLRGLLPASPFLPPGDLVIVDVETTGWLADEAGITEIGAVRLSAGRPMAEFSE